ncbi:MAG: exosortase C-terminal domain/associated protein EpsI [bacterium]
MKTALALSTALVIIAGLMGNWLRFGAVEPSRAADLSVIPDKIGDYVSVKEQFVDGSENILNADASCLKLYRAADQSELWLYVAYFSSQKYGRQIHSPRHCLPGGGWTIEWQQPFVLPAAGGDAREVNRALISHRGEKHLMFYWFETRGTVTCNEFSLKWQMMKNSLLCRATDAAMVRLTLPLKGRTVDEATASAMDFIEAAYPGLQAALSMDN